MDRCPICGHMEVVTMKKFTHAMSEYVSVDGKSAGIFNSDEPKITVQPKGKPQSELTRKDVYEEAQKKAASKPVVPTSSATVLKPNPEGSASDKPLLTS